MHRRLSREDGQGLIEFAIVFPLFVFFLFAVFEVGLAMNRQATLQHAVREGARAGAVVDDGGDEARARTVAQSQDLLAPGDVDVCAEDLTSEGGGFAINVTAHYTFQTAILNSVIRLASAGQADYNNGVGIAVDVHGSSRAERKLEDPGWSAC